MQPCNHIAVLGVVCRPVECPFFLCDYKEKNVMLSAETVCEKWNSLPSRHFSPISALHPLVFLLLSFLFFVFVLSRFLSEIPCSDRHHSITEFKKRKKKRKKENKRRVNLLAEKGRKPVLYCKDRTLTRHSI